MLKDKDGNRLFRKVAVKVVFPDAIFPPKTFVQHAGPQQGFGPTGIDDILMRLAEQLDTLYPWWDFKVVELAPEGRTAKYVLTFAGYRQPPTTESTTLEPGPSETLTPADAGNSVAAPVVQE
jgi:hypothetical protein